MPSDEPAPSISPPAPVPGDGPTGPPPPERTGHAADARRDTLVLTALRVWTVVGVLVAGLLAGRLLTPLRPLLTVALLVVVLVALLAPLVDAAERRGVPRPAGTALTFAGVGLVVALLVRLAVPVVTAQVTAIVEALPELLDQADRRVTELLGNFGVDVDLDIEELPRLVEDEQARSAALSVATGFGSFAGSVVSRLFLLLLAPVVAFYLLVDLPRVRSAAIALAPAGRRDATGRFLADAAGSVTSFIRGQLVVAAFVGVATGLAVALIGIPYAVLIGLAAGLTNLVPFIGPFIGGALAVAVALATGEPVQALLAVVAVLVVQQVESHVVSPLVVGRAVRLRPLAVVLAVIAGGMLAGLLGLLVAVPAVTVARAAVRQFRGDPAASGPDR